MSCSATNIDHLVHFAHRFPATTFSCIAVSYGVRSRRSRSVLLTMVVGLWLGGGVCGDSSRSGPTPPEEMGRFLRKRVNKRTSCRSLPDCSAGSCDTEWACFIPMRTSHANVTTVSLSVSCEMTRVITLSHKHMNNHCLPHTHTFTFTTFNGWIPRRHPV